MEHLQELGRPRRLLDEAARSMRTREHGGPVRTWNHTLRVEPLSEDSCRYSDTVDIDAGRLTPLVTAFAEVFYGHRHRRWRKLVRTHLLPADDLRGKVR
ncbi:hypothetical protein [Actinocorallia aurantiaca]